MKKVEEATFFEKLFSSKGINDVVKLIEL